MGKTDFSIFKVKPDNNVRSSLKLKCPFLLFLLRMYFQYAFRILRILCLFFEPKRYARFCANIMERYLVSFDYYLEVLIEMSMSVCY